MSDAPEFSRPFDIRGITADPVTLEADADERAALAQRFGLVAIARLAATLSLEADGDAIAAEGVLTTEWVQPCAVSGEDLPMAIEEPVALRFVPAATLEAAEEDEEIELDKEDLDEIGYEGTTLDLGEAVAQSLALAIDPFATGPAADEARRRHGLVEEGEADGPLADALRGLKGS
ncbi:YceD family protein [Aurantiacibacter hainanensis]|uniref:YceD family protein n=1 Tax=Aurantiacibacter hainanensis TaxID=3076114 RepID=UPI0030C6DE76